MLNNPPHAHPHRGGSREIRVEIERGLSKGRARVVLSAYKLSSCTIGFTASTLTSRLTPAGFFRAGSFLRSRAPTPAAPAPKPRMSRKSDIPA